MSLVKEGLVLGIKVIECVVVSSHVMEPVLVGVHIYIRFKDNKIFHWYQISMIVSNPRQP